MACIRTIFDVTAIASTNISGLVARIDGHVRTDSCIRTNSCIRIDSSTLTKRIGSSTHLLIIHLFITHLLVPHLLVV
jgi:hypothetical protein